MEMHQIRYFLAVARALNFTRAAEECHVSQPALTRAIKSLEDELGGELFRRERVQSHLTDLGHRMLPLLQQCYETVQGAKSIAASLKSGEAATLRLALARTIDLKIMLPFLTELTRAMNGLQFKFIRGTTAEIADILKAGEADIALAGPMTDIWDRLDARALFTEPLVLIVQVGHRFAVQPSITLNALRDEQLVLRTHCETYSAIMDKLSIAGVSGAHHHQVASESDLISMIDNKMGVALAPKSTVTPNSLTSVAVTDLSVTRTVYLYSVAGRPRSASVSALMQQLLAADWQLERASA